MKFNLISKKSMALLIATVFIASSTIVGCSSQTTQAPSDNTTVSSNYKVTEEGTNFRMPNAPTTPAWLPSQLLEADIDKDALYNKSSIPLKDRIPSDKLSPVNKTQNNDTKVTALSIMNANTSGNIPHGSNTFEANTFSYYQYIDKLIYWGGSAGEGIIVPPSPDVVDSAHTNGVPILGTIFFPPFEYGAKAEWLDEFLQKDDGGNFLIIDKLIEVAEKFGFDGWFINQETNPKEIEGKDTLQYAKLFEEFLLKFREKSNDKLQVMWYDSMTNEGVLDWQNALNDKNKSFMVNKDGDKLADSMFLNFWWTTDKLAGEDLLNVSKENAKLLGISPYDIYAGIDVQADGVSTPIKWDLLEKDGKTATSIGLYCPSWTFFSSEGDSDQFQNKEEALWVNEFANPSKDSKATGTQWRGISKFVTEQSVVNTLPFETNFNLGNGYNFFIDGEKVSELDWNNRSLAGIMPTYRWIVDENGNSIKPSIDYSTAYYGGNSIKLLSNLKMKNVSSIKLFSANLKIDENTTIKTYAKANSTVNLDLKLTFDDGEEAVIKADKVLSENWQEISYDVKENAGKTIKTISYNVSSEEDKSVNINIGKLSIKDSNAEKNTNIDVTKVNLDDSLFEEEDTIAGINLSWEANDGNLKNYEIFMKNQDGTLSLLGVALNNRFFIDGLARGENIMESEFVVRARNKDGNYGNASSVKITWPDNTLPKADFKASKTQVAPNEEVTFTNLSNKLSKSYEWTFEGANIETSTDENPVVKYEKEGTYTVKLIAKNEKGENEITKEGLVVVTENAKEGLKNFALNAPIEASSFVNDNEGPQFAVDGDITKKWCAVGQDQHNITIDLGEVKEISEIVIHHAEEGGESPDMNTEEYKLEVSEDGKDFKEVLNVEKNTMGLTTDAFKPVKARYARLTILKPTQGSDSATRIYEIEIKGL